MHTTLYRAQRILLGLLLGTAGLYAGVLMMYSIGLAPVLDALSAENFLKLWQLHDYYLHLRIRFLLIGIGVLYLLTLLCFATAVRTKTFAFIALACVFSIADLQINRTLQRPVNRSIRLADVGAHSSASVYGMERQLFHALHLRQFCSIGAFGLLCVAAMLPHRRPSDSTPDMVAQPHSR
ncbi:DUF1772 domain-containing protein [Terriglobus aquaticus]|uniref:DUF1772 domain-containing protein n=1 Tax=Terriglobus aquaticus TaxID=940139 RepID=A0ABW9KH47_9BACT|nr:DUF1772 domain-containing protein [Terriglobus aquaticus]